MDRILGSVVCPHAYQVMNMVTQLCHAHMRLAFVRFSARRSAALSAALLVPLFAPHATLAAQNATAANAPAHAASVAPTSASTREKRVLSLGDYGKWNRVNATSLSGDGKWMTYVYQPNEGDGTLYVRSLDSSKTYTIPVGSAPIFSDDAKFVAYVVSPPERAGGRGGRGGAPAPGGAPPTTPPATPPATPPGGRGAAGAAPVATRRFEMLDLATGEKTPIANASTFKFSENSKWVAVRLNKAVADAKHNGADLILRDLTTGAARNIGNVNLYEFDEAGRYLAYTVDAADKMGNGVYLIDLSTGNTRVLDGGTKDFDQLVWKDKSTSLAVLRGEKGKDTKQKDNVLLAWLDIGAPTARTVEFDPSKATAFPKGMVVSEFTAPRFSKDGSKLMFGIKEQEPEVVRSEEPQANVDVWHFKDPEPQSVQIVRLAQERRSTYPSAIDLASKAFLRLADSSMRAVTPTANAKWGIGRLDAPYRGEVAWGGSHADYYRVNMATGERTLIAKSLTRTMGTSPDSKWFLYLEKGNVFAYNLETGKSTQIDAAAKKSFVDADDDHPYERPVYGVAGWSKDGKSVLLNDRFDIWQLALDGSKATNLTQGVGDAQSIRFRLARLDAPAGGRGGRGGGGPAADEEDAGVDLLKPLLLSAYGEWTKKSGYYTLAPGKAPTPLIYADKEIGAARKAEHADRVMFTEQTFTEFPDWWVTNSTFASPKKITDANPQLADFAWGSKVLIDYTNSKGVKLQGTLTLPANYQPGKKYPMLVYFYEKMSNTHHNFSMPTFDDRPQMSTYASDGYLMFQPDVVYEIGRPGSSAVDCVTSAVKKVIELGYADPKHIGLQGHSWGGYQSSFIVTQTDMFAAVVTGAPPANLMSFYDQLYKQTGTVQQGIMELGQVRMGVDSTPWTAKALYESQSPVHNVQNIKTPFLILHGTADGAVDWVQGLEYFNAARRNGKNVILLSYPDEPHHLAKKENQKDFQIRMKQYFDHYLKDAPAPKWMTDGVPQVRKGGPIQ